MKCQEIILQLMKNLPRYSPFFSVKKDIASVSFSLGTATATTTTPHGQVAGSFVSVADVLVPCAVDTVTPVGNTLVLKTLTQHDFTLNRNVPSDQNQIVRITTLLGFSSGYKLLDVPNRKTLVIEQSLVPFPTDPAFVQEKFHYGYNGLKEILTVPTPSSFTYLVDDIALAAPNDISNSPYVGCSIRVSGAADLLTMMNSYTAQPPDNIWACVVLEDNVANKDRRTLNDALTQQGRQMDFAQQLISNFAVYIIIPNKGEVLTETNGRLARDMIEDIRVPIFKTLLGIEFRTDLAAQGESCVTYAGDGFVSFNGVVYVHQFSFQQVLMITSSDTAIESFDRAFRDIDLSIRNQFSDVTAYTVLPVDLDDFP